MPETAIDEGTRLKILDILKKSEPASKPAEEPANETGPKDHEMSRIFRHGGKTRGVGKRTFVVFNHAETGSLCTQWFEDIWEKGSDRADGCRYVAGRWILAESSEEKIAGFKQQAHVINLVVADEAKSHAEAIAIAREKFGSKPIQKEETR